jgi:hypothetical protein
MGSPPVWVRSYDRNSAPRKVASDGALSETTEIIVSTFIQSTTRQSVYKIVKFLQLITYHFAIKYKFGWEL